MIIRTLTFHYSLIMRTLILPYSLIMRNIISVYILIIRIFIFLYFLIMRAYISPYSLIIRTYTLSHSLIIHTLVHHLRHPSLSHPNKHLLRSLITPRKKQHHERIHKQVLLSRPVLRWCPLPPYVPLPVIGSANVPAMNRS